MQQQGRERVPKNHPGWNTTSDDYLRHLTRLEKEMSSLADVREYPNVYPMFNKEIRAKPTASAAQYHPERKLNFHLSKWTTYK